MTAAGDDKARVVALAGGKGGVGTSLLAANLAIHLARQGREVVVADLAPGGPDLHQYLGIRRLPHDLGDRLRPEAPPLADLTVTGGISNLHLLAGIPDRPRRAPLTDAFGAEILEEARQLPCDFVIADVGSGRSAAVRNACAAADTTLLVGTPEPAAVRGVLALQAAITYGLLERSLGVKEARTRAAVLENKGMRALLANMKPGSRPRDKALAGLRGHGFGLLLNKVRTAAETEAAARIGAVLSMLQAVIVDPVLTLEYDLSALQAAAERCVLAQRYPNAPIVRGLEKTALCLLTPAAAPRRAPNRYAPLESWHHYRLLALAPKASPREVQRHYERLRPPFQAEGEAEAIASRASLDKVSGQIEAAYRTLVFLENRREYDREMVATGVLSREDLRDHEPTAVSLTDDVPAMPSRMTPASGASAGATPTTAGVAPDTVPGSMRAPTAPASSSAEDDGSTAVPPAADPVDARRAATPHAETAVPVAASKESADEDTEPAAEVPVITDAFDSGPPTRYDGAVLRSLRQRRRLDLEKISAVTKIRPHHIESIENEDYSELPVAVFVKGFLRAYARCLDLDAERVVEDYMDGYGAWARDRT